MEMRAIKMSYFAKIIRNSHNSRPASPKLMRRRENHYTSGKLAHLLCKTEKHNLKFVKIQTREGTQGTVKNKKKQRYCDFWKQGWLLFLSDFIFAVMFF